ncbi:acyl-CoA dehydrogenase [Nocardia sp. MDA0666]|uniref:acyl-CoA dehydrogenase family protein n=1 Tax=Nocardia sp. MDA0666 TaxID=2135448 RepID=UPI000D124344|nr:acyl-CoA dehydrogenase family protein [Nocardia sp. MDA0666]PSR68941.1 acyl-CoA dehydrogenase [Nocardia sp. MDA0666]
MTDTAELQELAATVRAVLTRHGDRAALRQAIDSELGYDERLWQLLCEQVGVAALAIPEEYGGVGADLDTALVVLEELGRTLHNPPMLGSAVLGVQALLATGDADAAQRLLPGVAEGTRTLAVCWADDKGWATGARASAAPGYAVRADGDALTGTARYVLDGANADTLLVVTADGLYEIDATASGVTRTVVRTMDPTRRLSTVAFDGAAATRLGGDADAITARLRAVAWTALAAEQVGAADQCLDLTVEYSKSRVQFGRAIGSFQALKHRMADMYVLVESARSAAYAAIADLDRPVSAETTLDLESARIHCSHAFRSVVSETVQMHGGIAITWEHDAHLFFKRAHGDAELFGMPGRPLARPA